MLRDGQKTDLLRVIQTMWSISNVCSHQRPIDKVIAKFHEGDLGLTSGQSISVDARQMLKLVVEVEAEAEVEYEELEGIFKKIPFVEVFKEDVKKNIVGVMAKKRRLEAANYQTESEEEDERAVKKPTPPERTRQPTMARQ